MHIETYHLNDLGLWEQYFQGDLNACDRLFNGSGIEALVGRLRKRCRQKGIPAYKAKDLIHEAVQETYLAFREKVRVKKLRADMLSYLAKCCWRRIVKELITQNSRTGKFVPCDDDVVEKDLKSSDDPSKTMDRKIAVKEFIRMSDLSPDQELYVTLWLSGEEGRRRYGEIARLVNKSLGVVKVQMNRAKPKLRKAYFLATGSADCE